MEDTTKKKRWGETSIRIETHLRKKCIRVGGRGYVRNFSSIARKYGVTRELVRQIAEAEDIGSYLRADEQVKRKLVRRGMRPVVRGKR